MERESAGPGAQERAWQGTLAVFPSPRAHGFNTGGAAKRRAKGKDGFKNPVRKEKTKNQKPEGADIFTDQLAPDIFTDHRQPRRSSLTGCAGRDRGNLLLESP